MRRSAIWGVFMMIPALFVFTAAPGCSKKEKGGGGAPPAETVKRPSGDKPSGDKPAGTGSGSKKPLDAKLDGTIKGNVKYDGKPPEAQFIKAIDSAQKESKDVCLQGKDFEKNDQQWIVGSDKGVANVLVFLTPPDNTYFNIRPEDKKPKDVNIDQPHCAFIPHVLALFPQYYDGAKTIPTGQKLIVHNSAPITHNTKIRGTEFANPQKNLVITPKDTKFFEVKYQKPMLEISCDVHPWMRALAFTFDNPYHAVTDMDGNFTIEHVPTGVEVTVHAWHEGAGEFKKDQMSFKAGENTLDLKVKK